MDIIIPIAPHEYMDNRVLDGIQQLRIPHSLWIQESESKDVCPSKMDRIINARNQLRPKTTSDIVLCMDSDVVLNPILVHQALDQINKTPTVGMLGIPTDMDPGHVKIKCALVRGVLLRTIPFRWDLLRCECICFAKDIKYRGYQTQYLETDPICEVIDNERHT